MIKAGESNICIELPPDLSVEKDKTNNTSCFQISVSIVKSCLSIFLI